MENIVSMLGYNYNTEPGREKEEENYKSIVIDELFFQIYFSILFCLFICIYDMNI